MKVKANSKYIFYPNGYDKVRPAHQGIVPGSIVKVVNLPGCPSANTMGHAHVEVDGKFMGLVSTNSLYGFEDKQLVIDALKRDAEKQPLQKWLGKQPEGIR